MSEQSNFHDRLRSLVNAAGSAHALAQQANLSPAGLHRILHGGEPSRPVLLALAAAGNVSVEWLATGAEGTAGGPPPCLDRAMVTEILDQLFSTNNDALERRDSQRLADLIVTGVEIVNQPTGKKND